MLKFLLVKAALCLGALAIAIACGESGRDDVSTTRPGGAGGALVTPDSGGVAIPPDSSLADAASDACVATCLLPGAEYAPCANCVDDDGDGAIDLEDPQCLTPSDGSEDRLHQDVMHFLEDPCRFDCYFDDNSGSGDDGCLWRTDCDPFSPNTSCPYDPSRAASCAMLELEQSGGCAETCIPVVPNGCDCFGCCELPAGSGQYVWLGSGTCEVELAEDPTVCPPCTPVRTCLNPCEECELCLGRGSLPAGCGDEPLCPSGAAPCGSCPSACPAGSFCLQGCCTL